MKRFVTISLPIDLQENAASRKAAPAGYYSRQDRCIDGQEFMTLTYEGSQYDPNYPPFTYLEAEMPLDGVEFVLR